MVDRAAPTRLAGRGPEDSPGVSFRRGRGIALGFTIPPQSHCSGNTPKVQGQSIRETRGAGGTPGNDPARTPLRTRLNKASHITLPLAKGELEGVPDCPWLVV